MTIKKTDRDPDTIRKAIIFMMIHHPWQLVAMVTVVCFLVSFALYGSINTEWFKKDPIKILDMRGMK